MPGSWLLFSLILFLSGPVEEARFSYVPPFSEGVAAVCLGCQAKQEGEHLFMAGGRWGYINRKGELLIPPAFEEAKSFDKGRA